MESISFKPIGVIHSPFRQAAGTPIQPAFARDARGTVELYSEFAAGLQDLDGFERLWLIYLFDRCRNFKLVVTPYLDTHPHGLFATRAPARPNPIGLSPVKLEKIEANILTISDVDILDGTPLLDIKPYSPRFDCFPTARDGWLEKTAPCYTVADDRFHEK